MITETVEKQFKQKVCKEVRLFEEGKDRFRVFTPFQFDDGDSLAIVLKRNNGHWLLSDEGHTFMHLSYYMDVDTFEKGTRAKIISDVLTNYGIEDNNGSLTTILDDENAGNVFYNYIQGLIKISDVSYLIRERVRSTFLEDFKAFMENNVEPQRLKFDYYNKEKDPQGKYTVDCRVNGMARPLFIYAINNDGKCRDATISLLQFEKWQLDYRSISIFEDQEKISRKVLARFSDVCEKQFSTLASNKDRIEKYLKDNVE